MSDIKKLKKLLEPKQKKREAVIQENIDDRTLSKIVTRMKKITLKLQ